MQALLFLLFDARGHLCRLELVWRKPGFVNEIQMQDYFAGCHAETFSRSWGGSADNFTAAECARFQQLFRVSVLVKPSTRASLLTSATLYSVLDPPRMPGGVLTTSCANRPLVSGRRRSGGQKAQWGLRRRRKRKRLAVREMGVGRILTPSVVAISSLQTISINTQLQTHPGDMPVTPTFNYKSPASPLHGNSRTA